MQRDQAHRTNELLERIAIALEKNNKKETETTNEIPGFEGVLNDLDNLYQPNDPYNSDYVSTRKAILEQQALTPTSNNPDPAGYGNKDEYETDGTSVGNGKYEDEYEYEYDLQGIRVDSDHDIRSTAAYYEDAILSCRHRDLKTKKDAILDYVTNEFKSRGARYTDIIKFAYYLGSSNAPKYDNSCRGYYAMAFAPRYGGHLIQGGKDFLVKGINKEGKERYFAHSNVDSFTDYYKRIS